MLYCNLFLLPTGRNKLADTMSGGEEFETNVTGLFLPVHAGTVILIGKPMLEADTFQLAFILCGASCWTISDVSICSGLEQTYLLRRSQFLTSKEVEALGLSGATILIYGGYKFINKKAIWTFNEIGFL
ncbi:unnamed protein product [Camellia sinensis]